MRPLAICMPYYENAGMLRTQVEAWAAYPDAVRAQLVVVIADDGSPTAPAAAALDGLRIDFDLRVFRIGVNIPWNQCGARNLAMHCAPDGWCLVTDMDHVLEADQVERLLALPARPDRYYVPARRRMPDRDAYKPHPNSYYLTRSLYWRAGGCDEDFAGWYGSDSQFRRALTLVGQRVELAAPALTLYGREVIADASTTEWGRKDSPHHSSRNPVLRAKRATAYKARNPLRFPWERVR